MGMRGPWTLRDETQMSQGHVVAALWFICFEAIHKTNLSELTPHQGECDDMGERRSPMVSNNALNCVKRISGKDPPGDSPPSVGISRDARD